MTVTGIKYQPVGDSSVTASDSKTVENNSFNSSKINPFMSGDSSYVQKPVAPKETPLFGNKIINENTTNEPQTQSNNWFNSLKNTNVGWYNTYVPTHKATSPFNPQVTTEKANLFSTNRTVTQPNKKGNEAAIKGALSYFPSASDLQLLVESNPRITAILEENGLPVKVNYNNLKTIKHTHIATTVEFARAIGEELGMSEAEIKNMEVGAALHDMGKSLIPAEILNKNGKLDQNERKIINLHSVLGYEILKSAGYGVNVAEIARDHHNPNSTNRMAQIVRAADVYSAMREERPYKTAKTHEEAMNVLRDMKIDSKILDALDRRYGTPNILATSNHVIGGTQPAVA